MLWQRSIIGPMHHTELLTAAQVAEMAGVARRTVTRWVEKGKLTPALRLPGETGALLFAPGDVDALLAATRSAS